MADHLIEWLPEFALTHSERENLQQHNAVALLRKAARSVYQTKNFSHRGEFGELLLHVAIRSVFETLPAITKIYFKDASNDTVKGFDAVHVVVPKAKKQELELWLGEAKFYDDAGRAIADVIAELKSHLAVDYLRNEFVAIGNKIDPTWAHADRLRRFIAPNTSLDKVVDRICIPVLLTYDSSTIASHKKNDAAYKTAFISEVTSWHAKFAQKVTLPAHAKSVRIHLFLMPLHTKKVLVQRLDKVLKGLQQ